MLKRAPDTLAGNATPCWARLCQVVRRSELVALTVADLLKVPDGLRVTIIRYVAIPTGRGWGSLFPGAIEA